NFRKNNISLMGTGHDTSDINYKLWKVKANTLIYMQGANVKSIHNEIDQGVINRLDRGEFVIPGFQKDHFELPKMPHETIGWIPNGSERKLRIQVEADIPNIVPSDDASEALDDSPLEKKDLVDLINTAEAADILEVKSRSVRRKISKDEIPAIEVNGKYVLSRPQISRLST
ncbi:MAG: helix-turn-helix domain-containing protein, partial [Candidatus Nanohaloarchaea archaeon]|nr:helix-turn-helix domain-containing protein [Candidatus Nanohaloarchaea archaeon]